MKKHFFHFIYIMEQIFDIFKNNMQMELRRRHRVQAGDANRKRVLSLSNNKLKIIGTSVRVTSLSSELIDFYQADACKLNRSRSHVQIGTVAKKPVKNTYKYNPVGEEYGFPLRNPNPAIKLKIIPNRKISKHIGTPHKNRLPTSFSTANTDLDITFA